ncbi:SHOCT domain-containing protein [Streptomyces finlayi]|nr:SHOCT domain-containing protein [Streptomyces finlayi]
MGQLAQLGRLAQQGLITPEEFAAAKAKLLGT